MKGSIPSWWRALVLATTLAYAAPVGHSPQRVIFTKHASRSPIAWSCSFPRGGSVSSVSSRSSGALNVVLLQDLGRSLWARARTLWNEGFPALPESDSAVATRAPKARFDQSGPPSTRQNWHQEKYSLQTSAAFFFSPTLRVVKLAVVAFALSEFLVALNLLETRLAFPPFRSVRFRAPPSLAQYRVRIKYRWNQWRWDGGLLRLETWKTPSRLSKAFRTQVSPQHQWAVGTTLGLVFSPTMLYIGAFALKLSVATYVCSEIYHVWKTNTWAADQDRHNVSPWRSKEEITNSDRNSDVQAWLDFAGAYLEYYRDWIHYVVQNPRHLRTVVPLRDMPREMQQGLLVGFALGVVFGA
jgi:hypothetical protein